MATFDFDTGTVNSGSAPAASPAVSASPAQGSPTFDFNTGTVGYAPGQTATQPAVQPAAQPVQPQATQPVVEPNGIAPGATADKPVVTSGPNENLSPLAPETKAAADAIMANAPAPTPAPHISLLQNIFDVLTGAHVAEAPSEQQNEGTLPAEPGEDSAKPSLTTQFYAQHPALADENVLSGGLVKGASLGHLDANPIDPTNNFQEALSKVGAGLGTISAAANVTDILGGIASKLAPVLSAIPGYTAASQFLAEQTALRPWTVGFASQVLKAAGQGSIFGALIKNNQSIAKNMYQSAGAFAAFATLAYPIEAFFAPSLERAGSATIDHGNEAKIGTPEAPGTPVKNTMYFRSPDGQNWLKVTQNGEITVPESSETQGLSKSQTPTLTSTQIEAFKTNPSLYDQLKGWLNGDAKPGIKINPAEAGPASTTPDDINDIASKYNQPSESSESTPSDEVTVYHGEKGKGVSEEQYSPGKNLGVDGDQQDLIRQLASEGNEKAQALVDKYGTQKIDYNLADPIIREAYGGKYDSIKYGNSSIPMKGAEYHDLNTNKFYSEKPEIAEAYSLQNRGAKYDQEKPDQVFVTRHGVNENDETKIAGDNDQPDISEKGQEQMNAAIPDLKGKGITDVISSDAKRAVTSAKIVADGIGAKTTVDKGLRTQDIGNLAGKPSSEADAIMKYINENHPDQKVGGNGESYNEFKARVQKSYAEQMARVKAEGGTPDIIAHGDVAKLIQTDFGKKELSGPEMKHGSTVQVGGEEKNPTERPDKQPAEKKPAETPSSKKGKFSAAKTHAGFINPSGVVEGIKSKVSEVNKLIEKTQKNSEISGDTQFDLIKLQNSVTANEFRLAKFIQENAPKLTDESSARITNYAEDKTQVLTAEEKEVYDNYVKPLMDAISLMREKMEEMGLPVHNIQGEYTPHYPIDKKNSVTKLVDAGKKGISAARGKSSLSTSVGSKHRVYRAITDENGNRRVVAVHDVPFEIKKGVRAGDIVKSKRVTAFENKNPTDLGVFKLKTRESLMDKEIKPLQKRIASLQRTAKILESIKTREPVSEAKISKMQSQVSEFQSFIESDKDDAENPKTNAFVQVRNQISKTISDLNDQIAELETKEKNLQPYKDSSAKIASGIEKVQNRLADLYDKESNLSLSDVYQQVSEMADRVEKTANEDTQQKNADISRAETRMKSLLHDIKLLSNVKSGEDVILRSQRLSTINSKIVDLVNKISDIEAQNDFNNSDEKVFTGSDGKTYTMGEATIKEIEENTDQEYYKNPIVNTALAYGENLKAYNAAKWLENYKNSEAFKEVAVKESDVDVRDIPAGWKPTTLPQFRGYVFEPRTAEVLDDFNKALGKPNAFSQALDTINGFILKLTLLNPIAHTLNTTTNWAVERGATSVLNPKSSSVSFAKAWNAVKNKNEDYLKMLESGAPLMGLKDTGEKLSDILLNHMSQIAPKDEQFVDAVRSAVGNGYQKVIDGIKAIPKGLHSAAFFGGDLLMMQSLYQEMDLKGISFDEALKNVTKYQSDYRLPSRIADQLLTATLGEERGGQIARTLAEILKTNKLLAFSSYHISGLIKPWANGFKDAFNPKEPLNNPDRIKAWTVILTAALLYVAKQEVQKELQKITNNPNLYVKGSGMIGVMDDVIALLEGNESAKQFLSHFFTPAPVANLAVQLVANKDLFTGNPIFGPLGEGILSLAGTTFSSATEVGKAAQNADNFRDYMLSLFGIHAPSSTENTPIQKMIFAFSAANNLGQYGNTGETPAQTLEASIRSDWQSGKISSVRSDLESALSQGFISKGDLGGMDPKTATEDELEKFFKDNETDGLKIKADLPPDVRAFSNLPAATQKQALDAMSYPEILKYGWYDSTPSKDFHDTDAEIEFASAANKGTIKPPTWEKGQLSAADQLADAREGKKPSFPSDTISSKGGILQTVAVYAKAIVTSPEEAFNEIFHGQLITRVDNGTVYVQRMNSYNQTTQVARSEAIRKQEAAADGYTKSQLDGMQLDHFIALEVGGDNQLKNLDLISTEQNEVENAKIETPLAAALKAGKISKDQVLEYVTRYKIGTLHEVPSQYYLDLYKNKYGSQPMTLQQVLDGISSGKNQ